MAIERLREVEYRPELEDTVRRVEDASDSPTLLAIFVSPEKGVPMRELSEVQALAGVGLEGDRYAKRVGAYSIGDTGKEGRIPDDDRQVSIISAEGIDTANAELRAQGIDPFSPAETRRNLLVSASADDLNALVGREFTIGGVRMIGVEQCDPCTRPSTLLKRGRDRQQFEAAFQNRGGLRARILSDGGLQAGNKMAMPRGR